MSQTLILIESWGIGRTSIERQSINRSSAFVIGDNKIKMAFLYEEKKLNTFLNNLNYVKSLFLNPLLFFPIS